MTYLLQFPSKIPKMAGKSQAMHMMANKTRQLPQVDHLFDIAVYGDPYFYVLHIYAKYHFRVTHFMWVKSHFVKTYSICVKSHFM